MIIYESNINLKYHLSQLPRPKASIKESIAHSNEIHPNRITFNLPVTAQSARPKQNKKPMNIFVYLAFCTGRQPIAYTYKQVGTNN